MEPHSDDPIQSHAPPSTLHLNAIISLHFHSSLPPGYQAPVAVLEDANHVPSTAP